MLLLRVLFDWGVLAGAVWLATLLVPGIDVDGRVGRLPAGLAGDRLAQRDPGGGAGGGGDPLRRAHGGVSALLVNAALLGLVALFSANVRVDSVAAAVVGGMVISVVAALRELLRPGRSHRPGAL